MKVVGSSETAEKIKEGLDALGYYVLNRGENLKVVVGPISRAVKYVDSKPVISVSENGEYVVPLTNIESGVSFIASIISDITNGTLVLTSKTSEMGVYSVQEFSWINGLYWTRRGILRDVNRKLIERGRVYVYSSGIDGLILPEGYEKADFPCDADILVGENSCKGLTLKPYKVIVGLKFIQPIPIEVILYSIKLTSKSIYLNEKRIDVIVTGVRNRMVESLAKLIGAEVAVIEGDTCESLLLNYGGKVVLKGVKRALGLETCLGVLKL